MAVNRTMALRSRRLSVAWIVALAIGNTSCTGEPDRGSGVSAGPMYSASPAVRVASPLRLAVHPLHNPAMLSRAYQPLINLLNEVVPGENFVLEASRDYPGYERKIRARGPDFLLANPWQTLIAMREGYVVLASAGEPEDFRGIILVRRDSGIREVADLRGKVVAYPAPTALAACIMPQWLLHTRGLDVNRDIQNRYVGSQESAIMSAFLRQSAAGVTWPPPWRVFVKEHPAEAAELQVIWETPSLINNAVLARGDVARQVREQVGGVLLGLEHSPRGRGILDSMQTARFLPAGNADYEVVRRYIARFEREVRPVEGR